MNVVPSGKFSVQTVDDRLELTIPGTLYGEHRFVFDRHMRTFEHDSTPVCLFEEITAVQVQAYRATGQAK